MPCKRHGLGDSRLWSRLWSCGCPVPLPLPPPLSVLLLPPIVLRWSQRAAGQVGVFSIICAVVLFGSSQAFTLLFGTTLAGYRNLTHSFFSLMSLLLGAWPARGRRCCFALGG